MAKTCALLLVLVAAALATEQSLPDPAHASSDELELLSREMRKRDLSKMASDAENLKAELASPSTSIDRRIEAADKMKKIYETLKFELYKSAFSESVRMIIGNSDILARKSCSDMGVHLDKHEDKYVVENCKKALRMVWTMLVADRIETYDPLLMRVKTEIRDYMSKRVNATKPSTLVG